MNPTNKLENILSEKVNNSSINFLIRMKIYTIACFLFNLYFLCFNLKLSIKTLIFKWCFYTFC